MITRKQVDDFKEAILKVKNTPFIDYSKKYIKIIDKDGYKSNFELNNIQKKVEETINKLSEQNKPIRIIILKPRQTGISTYVQAKLINKTTLRSNCTALVVAHTDSSTKSIFNKTKLMYQNLPDGVRPPQKASNAYELVFDKPTNTKIDSLKSLLFLNSRIKIATAGGTGIGRGDTHNYVHASELAFWEGDIKDIFIGIMQSVPKTSNTIVIIESTANGFNEFKTMWDKAINGENEFVPLFFSWMDHEEYQMFVTEEERKEIMSNLNEYESNLVNIYKVTAERIKWYRSTLANDCQGDHDLMKQENPSNMDEAFLHTGRPVYDTDKIDVRIKYLSEMYKNKPPDIGYLESDGNSINFIPDKNGTVIIYKHPKINYPYIIGVDVSEGVTDGDYSVASVCDNTTGEQVATQRLHIHPDLWADEIYKLALFYNKALAAIEENNHGLTTITSLQNRHKYYNQYKREIFDDISRIRQHKFGFKTTTITRPLIIDRSRAFVRENINKINDLQTLREMLTFIYDNSNKEIAEQGCFDDSVMSFAIMLEARTQKSTIPPVERNKFLDNKNVHWSMKIDAEKDPLTRKYLKEIYEQMED